MGRLLDIARTPSTDAADDEKHTIRHIGEKEGVMTEQTGNKPKSVQKVTASKTLADKRVSTTARETVNLGDPRTYGLRSWDASPHTRRRHKK
jgi:hypothetical protein